MKLVRVATLAVFVLAACASRESSEETPALTPDADAATPEAGGPGGADGAAEAEAGIAPRPKCTADERWCLEDALDLSSVGLPQDLLQFTGVVMDPVAGSWATSESGVNGGSPGYGGANIGHLFHLEGKVWTPRVGLRPGEPNALPFLLKSVASDGHGTVVAVGTSPPSSASPERVPIVFLIRPGQTDLLEDRPTNVPGFTRVLVANSREAWATDIQRALYHGVIGDSGPIVWTLETTPHYSPVLGLPPACATFWLTKAGDIACAARVRPPLPDLEYTVIDVRHEGEAGHVTWTTTPFWRWEIRIDSLTAGFESAPGKTWLSGYQPDFFVPSLFFFDRDRADPDAGLDGIRVDPVKPRVTFASIWGRAEDDIWAVGNVGRVFHYDGASWTDAALELERTPMTERELSAISGLPNGELWAVGRGTLIHRTP